MEQLQLKLGNPGQVLQQDYSTFATLATDCWLKTVWDFAWTNEIDITDTGPSLESY